MALRAIVFDFDGVLANSEPLHLRSFQSVLAREGITLTENDYYAKFLGFDDAGAFVAMGAAHGHHWPASHVAELVARKAAQMEILERDISILFPGAADVVRRAAAEVPIAIASGALGVEIRRVLDRERLTSYFTAIVAAEDTPVSKPAADPYQRALAVLAEAVGFKFEPSECIAIEDSPWGLVSAKAAGLHTVAVAHTYGRAALEADLIISSLDELDIAALERLCAT